MVTNRSLFSSCTLLIGATSLCGCGAPSAGPGAVDVVELHQASGVPLAATAGATASLRTAPAPASAEGFSFTSDLGAARERARRERRPMLVFFDAAWCAACRELDRRVFADPGFVRAASRFVAVKVDATDDEDLAGRQIRDELKVVGLPTVLLFDEAGNETFRALQFEPVETWIARVDEGR